jgi:hypothetical protein
MQDPGIRQIDKNHLRRTAGPHLRVKCRLAEEATLTAGVPQIAADLLHAQDGRVGQLLPSAVNPNLEAAGSRPFAPVLRPPIMRALIAAML